jgi:hypothetical protein
VVTQYRIEVGYNSSKDRDEVWEALKQVVIAIQDQPQRIIDEVLRIEPTANLERLKEFAVCYCRPVEDLTIKVIEDETGRYISQLASGGGSARDMKESCRRAFCRLVLEDMHRKKMEIKIVVC